MTAKQCIDVKDAKNIIMQKGKYKGYRLGEVMEKDPAFIEQLYEILADYSSLRAAILICWAKG